MSNTIPEAPLLFSIIGTVLGVVSAVTRNVMVAGAGVAFLGLAVLAWVR